MTPFWFPDMAPSKRQALAATLVGWLVISVATVAVAQVSSTLYPYGEFAALYDDNIDQAAGRNGRGDFISTELLGGSLQTDAPQKHFALDYSTLESQYLSTPSLDRTFQDHFVGASYDQRLSPNITFSMGDSLLIGDAVSSAIITGGQVPLSLQLLQGLLFRSSSHNNFFNSDISYSNPQSWRASATVEQLFFSGGGTSGESFGQGCTLTADHDLGKSEFDLGAAYSFEDFRFSELFPPTETHWPQLRLIWHPDANLDVLVRTGPIFADSFAGDSNGVPHSGGWTIDPGGMLQMRYSGRRFNVSIEGGQEPGLGAGLAGAALYRSASLFFEYSISRRLVVFVKQGFLQTSANGSSSQLITYSVGATNQISQHLSLTCQYYGIRNTVSGSSAQVIGVESGTNAVANLFLVGVIWQVAPIHWRW